KGIRVYKFNLDYVASIKWVVELPFNARLLSSTSISFSRLVNLLEVKHFTSISGMEIDIVQLGIVNQAELKLFAKAFFRIFGGRDWLVYQCRDVRVDEMGRMKQAKIVLVVCEAFVGIFWKAKQSMSPPMRQCYRWNIAFATGCRRVGRRKWTNRIIRVPAFMCLCRIEEELTLVKTLGKEVEEYVTKVIAKDGTVTRFKGRFLHFIEGEEEKKPKPYNMYGFVDLMENEQVYAKNGFSPNRIPQPEGNHNGLLSEEEEADSDNESTASNHPHTV
ncbi:hypothetical protein Tco_1171422, partial [Tanacetum coccineum]